LLAGYAAESGYGYPRACLENSRARDFEEAREILESKPFLRRILLNDGKPVFDADRNPVFVDVDESMGHYWDKTCRMLLDYDELVEIVAERLVRTRRLSGRSVAAMCREYKKRRERENSVIAA